MVAVIVSPTLQQIIPLLLLLMFMLTFQLPIIRGLLITRRCVAWCSAQYPPAANIAWHPQWRSRWTSSTRSMSLLVGSPLPSIALASCINSNNIKNTGLRYLSNSSRDTIYDSHNPAAASTTTFTSTTATATTHCENIAEHPINIPDKLRRHIYTQVQQTLSENLSWAEGSNVNEQHRAADLQSVSSDIILQILRDPVLSANNQAFHNAGETIVKALKYMNIGDVLKKTDDLSAPVNLNDRSDRNKCSHSHSINVLEVLQEHAKHKAKRQQVFHTIAEHHNRIASESWASNVHNTAMLQQYAEAATEMGTSRWVREAHDWAHNFCTTFFHRKGAKKHFLKLKSVEYRKENGGKEMPVEVIRALRASLADDILLSPMDAASSASALPARPLNVLDVGSCYNPLHKHYRPTSTSTFTNTLAQRPHPAAVGANMHVTAIDLHPMHSSVLKCDFLDLSVGALGTAPIIVEPAVAGTTGTNTPGDANTSDLLLQLPASSQDVVLFSLVLSYLPLPEQRAVMLKKARELLRSADLASDDGGGQMPHKRGILLIIEKESIFNRPPMMGATTSADGAAVAACKETETKTKSESGVVVSEAEAEDDEDFNYMVDALINSGSAASSNIRSTTCARSSSSTSSPSSTSSSSSSSSVLHVAAGAGAGAGRGSGRGSKTPLLKNWKDCISSYGFDLITHQVLPCSDGKKAHVFAFSTRPIPPTSTDTSARVNTTSRNTTTSSGSGNVSERGVDTLLPWIAQDLVSTRDRTATHDNDHDHDIDSRSSRSSSSSGGRSVRVRNNRPRNVPATTAANISCGDSSSNSNSLSTSSLLPVGIVGGGIGGSALALALQRKNIPCVVFERDTSFEQRKSGYALTMQQASRMLRALGVGDSDLREKGGGVISAAHISFASNGRVLGAYGAHINSGAVSVPCTHIQSDAMDGSTNTRNGAETLSSSSHHSGTPGGVDFSSTTRQSVCNVEAGKDNNASVRFLQHKSRNIHVPRQRLRELLLDKLTPGTVQWNKRLSHFEVMTNTSHPRLNGGKDRPLKLYFDDGSTQCVSALCGADGIFSHVRKLLFASQFTKSGKMGEGKTETETEQKCENGERQSRSPVAGLKYLNLMVILGIAPIQCNFDVINASATAVASQSPSDPTPDAAHNNNNNSKLSSSTSPLPYCQLQWLDGNVRCFVMPYDANNTMWQLSFPLGEEEALSFESLAVTSVTTGVGSGGGDNANSGKTRGELLQKVALEKCSDWAAPLLHLLKISDPALVSGHPVYDRDPLRAEEIEEMAKCVARDSSAHYIAADGMQAECRAAYINDHGQDAAAPAASCVGVGIGITGEQAGEEAEEEEEEEEEGVAVTLLGDAAHPMSPFKGQGANQALLDAVHLAGSLVTSSLAHPSRISISKALRRYERDMCPRTAEKVLKSRFSAKVLHDGGELALAEGNVTRAQAAVAAVAAAAPTPLISD